MAEKISLTETIREAFGRSLYSHKTHEVMIDQLSKCLSRLSRSEIFFTSVSATGILSAIIYDEIILKIIAGIFSFFSLSIVLYKMNLKAESKMVAHRSVANKLWLIRERYINLLSDLSEGRVDDNEAVAMRDALMVETSKIYNHAPQSTPKAYAEAQRRLKECEDFTFSDSELNKFLPKSLAIKE